MTRFASQQSRRSSASSRATTTKSRSRFLATSLALLVAAPLFAQASREPKRATDHERMIDKVAASRAYDANARALLNPKFRDALDHYAGAGPQLASAWGEFVAADATVPGASGTEPFK